MPVSSTLTRLIFRAESDRFGKRSASVSGPSILPPIMLRPLIIVLCTMAVFLLMPLFIVIALAIKMESRGPVLVMGSARTDGDTPLGAVRFRTILHEASQEPTRIGRLLIGSGLDMLPQIFEPLLGITGWSGNDAAGDSRRPVSGVAAPVQHTRQPPTSRD